MSDEDLNDLCNQDDDSIPCSLCGGRFDCTSNDGIVIDAPQGPQDAHWTECHGQIKLCCGCAKQAHDAYKQLLSDGGVCEHGEREGDWCEACNREYKMARIDPDNR